MDIRVLRTFVAVAQLKGFSAAARALNIVQPAVSRQISDLETELGVALFWRSTREVRITAAGEILLREAQQILEHEARARKLVQRAGQGQVGRLRIGFIGAASQPFLPGLLRRFAQARPEVQVSLMEMTAQDQSAALQAGQLDISLSRPLPPGTPETIRSIGLYVDRLLAYVPESHRLVGAPAQSLATLAADPFVLFQRAGAPGLYDRVISACRAAGVSPDIAHQPNSMQAVLTAVASGLGVSVAPGCIRHLSMTGCRCLPLSDSIAPIPFQVHFRADIAEPPVTAFVDLLVSARDEIRATMDF